MMMDKIKNLAVSDTGFIFDPNTGNTFLLNETALFLFNQLKRNLSKEEILNLLEENYLVEKDQAERDYSDFMIQLNELGF